MSHGLAWSIKSELTFGRQAMACVYLPMSANVSAEC